MAHDESEILEMLMLEAASLDVDVDPQPTPKLEALWDQYEDDVSDALDAFLERMHVDAARREDLVFELMDQGRAPINVLLTLRGEGVGIWDGRWDQYFTPEALKELQPELVRKLSYYADFTGGGALNDELRNAVLLSAGIDEGEPIYEPARASADIGYMPEGEGLPGFRNIDPKRYLSNPPPVDVIVRPSGGETVFFPQNRSAHGYIETEMLMGHDYDPRIGGFPALPEETDEGVAVLQSAGFNVLVEGRGGRAPRGAPYRRNPPSWVEDEETWERAKAEVEPYWDKYDDPWAVVTHVYKQMGGEVAA